MTVPAPVGPYTPVVRFGNFLFCSGQIGVYNGELLEGLQAQTKQVFQNIRSVLKSENADLSDVIKTTVFLTDMSDYDAMNQIYAEEFGETRPARSAVAVSALPRAARIEIEVIAQVK